MQVEHVLPGVVGEGEGATGSPVDVAGAHRVELAQHVVARASVRGELGSRRLRERDRAGRGTPYRASACVEADRLDRRCRASPAGAAVVSESSAGHAVVAPRRASGRSRRRRAERSRSGHRDARMLCATCSTLGSPGGVELADVREPEVRHPVDDRQPLRRRQRGVRGLDAGERSDHIRADPAMSSDGLSGGGTRRSVVGVVGSTNEPPTGNANAT